MFEIEDILSVSQITNRIRQNLEEKFSQVSVAGEISNFKAHISGHWYFNLKDSGAVISCTMWKGMNNYVFFTPQDGMKIIANGRITVYPPRGNYQLDVRSMKPAGVGELQAAFERLKQKLSSEGLFDEQFKKHIPSFPKKIGIVTAIDGAAFRDMISVAKRRFPLVELIIAPSRVQGSGAAETIVESLKMLNQRSDIDVIILGRGGGSIEDLWSFNEEIVAREIFNSRIPVITGIGHEVDFTIADFAADLRAATPSAAMEIATPDNNEVLSFIKNFSISSEQNLFALIESQQNWIQNILNSYGFRIPLDLIRRKEQEVDSISYRFLQNMDKKIVFTSNKVFLLAKGIESHDINRALKKGFVLVRQDSKFISRAANFDSAKKSGLKFFDGEIEIDSTVK